MTYTGLALLLVGCSPFTVMSQTGSYYEIFNEAQGACLNAEHDIKHVITEHCYHGTDQKFRFSGLQIKNANWDDLCMDYDSGSGDVYMNTCYSGLNQKWYFDGKRIMNQWSGFGLCLTQVQGSGSNVAMQECGDGANQQWRIETLLHGVLIPSQVAGGGDGGDMFDHYNYNGYAGAISKICVKSGGLVDSIQVYYAGMPSGLVGGNGGDDQPCFELSEGEVITKIDVASGGQIDSLQFHTQKRSSKLFGGQGGDWKGTFVAPEGQHLMAMYGRSGQYLQQFGVYWGSGGGSGKWVQLPSCDGCSSDQYKWSSCTTTANSKSTEITNAWSVSVTTEMKFGFDIPAEIGSRGSVSITGSYSGSIVSDTMSSFSTTVCSEETTTCDKRYFWQWQFTNAFAIDDNGPVIAATLSPHKMCTDVAQPCCLPGTFSTDPTKCDLFPNSPNLCGKLANETVVLV